MSARSIPLPCPPAQADAFLSQPGPEVAESLRAIDGPVGVLGAGGKMGLHMCLMARKALDLAGRSDVEVVAVSRFGSVNSADAFRLPGIRVVPADLTSPGDLAALPDLPLLYFLAGIKFGTVGRDDLLHLYNIEMPGRVAKRFSGSTIVAFSTGCVYPFVDPASGGSTESDPPDPPGEYAQSCLGREQAFGRAAEESGARVALIRLNYSVEFRYGVLVDICRKVHAGEPVDVTMGYVNAIWQRDATDHILRCHALAASPAAPVNITGPGFLRVRDVAMRFGELLGREAQIVGEEAPTAWLNNASRSHAAFGAPSVSPDQMMEWIAAWQLEGCPLLDKPTGFEKRSGKF